MLITSAKEVLFLVPVGFGSKPKLTRTGASSFERFGAPIIRTSVLG